MKIPRKSKKKAAKTLEAIWSKRMALGRLKRIADSSIEAVMTGTVKGGGETEVKYNANAAATAIKAIETANKMLGYNEPEKEAGDDGVMIVFGEGEDFTV